MKNRLLHLLTFVFFLGFISTGSVFAEHSYSSDNVTLTLFYSDTCPHCHSELEFLDALVEKYPTLHIAKYEMSQPGSMDKFKRFAELHGTSAQWVPATFMCDSFIQGFESAETTGKDIEQKVIHCISNGCTDLYLLNKTKEECVEEEHNIVNVPFVGEVNLETVALPTFTLILGFLDGFNPCAMWVLSFLLTLLLYAKSRKKILLIGGIFVFASGFIYFLFMAAWFNFFLIIGWVDALVLIVAIVAILAGLINMKDFFFFKRGISLTIPDAWKPKLLSKMRSLVHESAMPAMIFGTIVLAFTANSFELICTFGFPAIYTRALTLQSLSMFSYYSYLVLYNVVYVIPLMVIVGLFAWKMGGQKFGEKEGRWLKLIGGLLMLALGLIMLIRPELLAFS